MKFFKLDHADAVMPARATQESVGYDVVAVDNGKYDDSRDVVVYDTGVKIDELPRNTFLALYPRSSVFKTHLRLSNSVGVIDPDYGDTIKVLFDIRKPDLMSVSDIIKYRKGDRIAQLVVQPYRTEGDTTKATRKGGLGSTGKKKLKFKDSK